MYPDALSIAANVVSAYADETGVPLAWWEVHIYRMISGSGWLVSATQTTIVLDKWMEKAA